MSILLNILRKDDIVKKLGGSGTRYDRVNSYFRGLGYTGTINDMEKAFLTDNGCLEGTLVDRWNMYLKAQGFDKGRLSDSLRAWSRA